MDATSSTGPHNGVSDNATADSVTGVDATPGIDVDLGRLAADIAAAGIMPPMERAATLRRLVDHARVTLGAAGDAAIAEATRTLSYESAAAALGVSVPAINKAITRHNRRTSGARTPATRPHPDPGDPGPRNRRAAQQLAEQPGDPYGRGDRRDDEEITRR